MPARKQQPRVCKDPLRLAGALIGPVSVPLTVPSAADRVHAPRNAATAGQSGSVDTCQAITDSIIKLCANVSE